MRIFIIHITLFLGIFAYSQEYDAVISSRVYMWQNDSLLETASKDSFYGNIGDRNKIQAYQAVCDDAGKLIYYVGSNGSSNGKYNITLFYPDGTHIKTIHTSWSVVTGYNSLRIVRIPKSQRYIILLTDGFRFQDLTLPPIEPLYFIVSKTSNGFEVSDSKVLSNGGSFYSLVTDNINRKNFWFVTQRYDSLLAYRVDENGLDVKPVKSKIQNYDPTQEVCTGIRFSLEGDALIIRTSNKNKDSLTYGSEYLRTYNFNKQSGEFTQQLDPICIPYFLKFNASDMFYRKMSNFSFWRNSKDTIMLTYTYLTAQKKNVILVDIRNRKIEPYNLKINSHPNQPFYYSKNIQYSTTGSQFVFGVVMHNDTFKESVVKLGNISRGDIECTLQVLEAGRVFLERLLPSGNSAQIIYRPHPLNFTYEQHCDSTLEFSVDGDTSFFREFIWSFEDGTKLQGKKVRRKIRKEGVHKVRLTGITESSYSRYMIDTFSVSKNYWKPYARFSLEDTLGCQWINKKFTNNSIVDYKGRPVIEAWNLGNNDTKIITHDSNLLDSQFNFTYSSTGTYLTSLILDDGFCADTFMYPISINILSAPEPELSLSSTLECIPVSVSGFYTKSDPVDKVIYTWGEYYSDTIKWPSTDSYTSKFSLKSLTKASDSIRVIQQLYGPTGCITADTGILSVYNSFEKEQYPEFELITTESSNTIYLQWDTLDFVQDYILLRNGKQLTRTSNTSYLDTVESTQAYYTYNLQATNFCADSSSKSEPGYNIVINGSTQDNEYAILNWNNQYLWNSPQVKLISTSDTLNADGESIPVLNKDKYIDYNFASFSNNKNVNSPGKYYKIIVEDNTSILIASSNTIRLDYSPEQYVPNAFSPNNDGLNDLFGITGIGISSYKLDIYNSYGQKIHSSLNEGWDGRFQNKDAPPGVYLYTINLLHYSKQRQFISGTLTLVR